MADPALVVWPSKLKFEILPILAHLTAKRLLEPFWVAQKSGGFWPILGHFVGKCLEMLLRNAEEMGLDASKVVSDGFFVPRPQITIAKLACFPILGPLSRFMAILVDFGPFWAYFGCTVAKCCSKMRKEWARGLKSGF